MASADQEETWYLLKKDKEIIFPGLKDKTKNKIIPSGTIVFSTGKEKKASSKANVTVFLKDKPKECHVWPRNELEKIHKSQVELLQSTSCSERFETIHEGGHSNEVKHQKQVYK